MFSADGGLLGHVTHHVCWQSQVFQALRVLDEVLRQGTPATLRHKHIRTSIFD